MWWEEKIMRTFRCRITPLDRSLHKSVARAVARVALDQGLNRDDLTGYFD